MRLTRILAAFLCAALGVAALAACAHAPDGRSVQQAVDEAVAGG